VTVSFSRTLLHGLNYTVFFYTLHLCSLFNHSVMSHRSFCSLYGLQHFVPTLIRSPPHHPRRGVGGILHTCLWVISAPEPQCLPAASSGHPTSGQELWGSVRKCLWVASLITLGACAARGHITHMSRTLCLLYSRPRIAHKGTDSRHMIHGLQVFFDDAISGAHVI